MRILIIGAGKVGINLAMKMAEKKHKVSLVEKNESICDKIERTDNLDIICGDGCDPLILELAGIKAADVVASVTGDDEDNLVIAQLAKLQPNRPRVVSIINNPKNEWLYRKNWGVDAAESPASIVARLIEEDIDKKI
ncbi:MAG: Trk system potassium uptake protein TrkA [Actinobacteria bacterium ADurb.Bin346]|nr:MAG: Trk system potassium uptake protein TrkA [Actinobacteria bacterium ADurb.Bin346]